jgi:hypothetical protein
VHLPALPLLCLSVLEREPTRPLIRTRLPADPTIAAGKQNAPERHRSKEGRAQRSKAEGHDARLGPHGVAVEGIYGVEDGGYRERGECIGSFGVGVGRCDACTNKSLFGDYVMWEVYVPSFNLLLSGTEPVSRTVNAPSVRSVKPSVRLK